MIQKLIFVLLLSSICLATSGPSIKSFSLDAKSHFAKRSRKLKNKPHQNVVTFNSIYSGYREDQFNQIIELLNYPNALSDSQLYFIFTHHSYDIMQ
jgi:hypothetical protein